MRIFNYRFLLVPGLFSLVLAGCADNAEEMVATAAALPVSISLPTQSTAAPQAPPDDPAALPPETVTEQGKAEFQYPFPDREDLFLLPTKKAPTNDTRVKTDDSVVLMGFADVGEARVVVKIDGIVTPLRVGESRGDVRVLAIDPPRVDLQRGERHWTASLADIP